MPHADPVARREYHRAYDRVWQSKNKAARSASAFKSRLKKRFGWTCDDYNTALEMQGGVCAICGGPPIGRDVRLAVDHDHETGAPRGLLCANCNNGLGRFKDRPDLLRRAAEYLELYATTPAKEGGE